ncbi:class I SAM-dependent methyltransferase [Achromobacter sp. GD03932]|uniref:class I SAM-dependent methyltransferase n=1 Tax=Achromobacter sp. GD03932 TaxID=2975407 RepID=UPI0024490B3E|nr:class I SAM-dependent methyltransferase [Achromobacter sp. GD03932]MDH1304339.1 class I SAM-dependent methyltransferase [Achromobacter sp. GD03932]
MSDTDVLNQALSDAYDETPYQSNAFSISAPGRLRAIAALYGLSAPPVENARVLELGCAAGGNLLPFAVAHPDARIVGIDLSPQQVEAGQSIVKAMGLQNLELRAMSITDITPEFGQFDYIIVHGVFSWVPPEVRQAIMRVCRENLTPEGVAYISYNTYPGWKASDIVRDAMILNSFGANGPQERLKRAKDVLSMLEHGLSSGNPMGSALQQAVRQLRKQSDYYLMHEHLEAVNAPCYFLEFVAAAQEAGLAYLADAEPQSSIASNYGDNVAILQNALSADAAREMREQYLDFAIGRQFRKSLLVHADRAGAILERPEANAFESMHLAARLFAQKSPANARQKERHYRTTAGTGIGSIEPTFVAVADALRDAWPQPLAYGDLLEAARAKVKKATPPDQLSELVLNHLITLLNVNALEYRFERVAYDASAPKPEWIPGLEHLRDRAAKGNLPVGLYNLWHQNAQLPSDEAAQFIIRHIDGKHSTSDLRTLVRDALAAGDIAHPSGKSMKRVRNLEPVAQTLLNDVLAGLRGQGLLR